MLQVRGDLVVQLIGQAVESLAFQRVGKPGDLPLGKLAGGVDAAVAHLAAWGEAVLRFPYLPVADAAHRREVERQRIFAAQHRHFVFQPGREHCVEAFGDAGMQHCTIRRQQAEREEVEIGR